MAASKDPYMAAGQTYVPQMACSGQWKHGPKSAAHILLTNFEFHGGGGESGGGGSPTKL